MRAREGEGRDREKLYIHRLKNLNKTQTQKNVKKTTPRYITLIMLEHSDKEKILADASGKKDIYVQKN